MTEEKRPRGRPRKPGGPTPKRNLRIGEVWDEAEQIANARGETITDVARPILERGLRRYIQQHKAAGDAASEGADPLERRTEGAS